jgi:hypothetical protein
MLLCGRRGERTVQQVPVVQQRSTAMLLWLYSLSGSSLSGGHHSMEMLKAFLFYPVTSTRHICLDFWLIPTLWLTLWHAAQR